MFHVEHRPLRWFAFHVEHGRGLSQSVTPTKVGLLQSVTPAKVGLWQSVTPANAGVQGVPGFRPAPE